jgi:hypothetical protein
MWTQANATGAIASCVLYTKRSPVDFYAPTITHLTAALRIEGILCQDDMPASIHEAQVVDFSLDLKFLVTDEPVLLFACRY